MPEGGAPEGGAPLCWRRLNMPRRRAAGVPEGGAPLGGGPEGLKVPVGRGGGVPLGGAPVPGGGGGPAGAGGGGGRRATRNLGRRRRLADGRDGGDKSENQVGTHPGDRMKVFLKSWKKGGRKAARAKSFKERKEVLLK